MIKVLRNIYMSDTETDTCTEVSSHLMSFMCKLNLVFNPLSTVYIWFTKQTTKAENNDIKSINIIIFTNRKAVITCLAKLCFI